MRKVVRLKTRRARILSQCVLRGDQAVVQRLQSLGDESYAGQHRHEVVVSRPARDDVEMDVILISGTSCGPEVESDIESLGLAGLPKEALGMEGEIPDIEHLGRGEILHECRAPVGNGHHVSRGVGIFVEHQEGVFISGDDKGGGIIGRSCGFREEILLVAAVTLKVFDAPGGPEGLEMFFWE